jgi:hypothetical protein
MIWGYVAVWFRHVTNTTFWLQEKAVTICAKSRRLTEHYAAKTHAEEAKQAKGDVRGDNQF